MVALPDSNGADNSFIRDLCTDRASTPIAAALQGHFASGGTAADGVRLVEQLERDALDVSKRRRKTSRGSRLSPDWQPSNADIAFAADRGLPTTRISTEAEKFRNYWIAKSGADACKRDWAACWRNRIINTVERAYGPSHGGQGPGTYSTPGRAPTGSDAILAGMGRLARRIDERRNAAVRSRPQISHGADAAPKLDLE